MLNTDRAQELYAAWFAPWVQALELEFLTIEPRRAVARLPANDAITRGPDDIVSGQAIMAAIDTVMVMATVASLGDEVATTTVSQTTNFLRPLPKADAIIDVRVPKVGRTLAFGDATVHVSGEPDRPTATATLVYAVLRS